jgi:hypothetical protein
MVHVLSIDPLGSTERCIHGHQACNDAIGAINARLHVGERYAAGFRRRVGFWEGDAWSVRGLSRRRFGEDELLVRMRRGRLRLGLADGVCHAPSFLWAKHMVSGRDRLRRCHH